MGAVPRSGDGREARILAERWAELDPALRLPGQGLGQKATGCGATIGIQPRCDFACTGCYLGHEANHIPALPTAAILRQLDELRAWLGPKSNVQITDGEVTLRPVEELTEILRYARSIGVIPMVMTHGDNLRRRPGLLEQLMTEGGLTEVSIHVDITQRGRDGYKAPKSELELMPLRDEFAAMVREARRRTGRPLRAAMTLTVTQDNLPQIADVVRWLVRNRDAFSLVSFQPLAQVGRTRKSQRGVTADELWAEVGRATAGFRAAPRRRRADAPRPHRVHPLRAPDRAGAPGRGAAALPRPPRRARGRGGDGGVLRPRPGRRRLPRRPAAREGGPLPRHGAHRSGLDARPRAPLDRRPRRAPRRGSRSRRLPRSTRLRGRLRLDGLTLTSHHFMSPAGAATPVGQDRLAACVFRLPYKGEMVPMCQMNADGVRERFYAEIAEVAHGRTGTDTDLHGRVWCPCRSVLVPVRP